MSVLSRRRIEAVLVEEGLISARQLNEIINEQKSTGKRIVKILLEKGFVTEDKLLAVFEEKFNIPQINFNQYNFDPDAACLIPAEMALRHNILPLSRKGERLILAMADPTDLAAVDDVAMVTGLEVKPVMAKESALNHLLARFYSLKESPETDKSLKDSVVREKGSDLYQTPAEPEAPVVRVINTLIERGIEEGASDIHLEPTTEGLRIRIRLDGVLHDLTPFPRHIQANLISRVKIMANLDIAEKRLSQDGNIQWSGSKEGISLRVSVLPTVNGEKVVIRFLEKEKIILPLDKLGFAAENFSAFLRLLLNRQGLLLVTGPTGCGKTTTLYSALHYLNRPQVNIVTVEDPVEYRLKGINQVQVSPKINRTFAGALRSILRQDPDIIMVGEIRDLETAKIASQAALTGHLVLSTLHTNNAAGAITRLVDMGLEDYLVTASLIGVIAQRLVRTICPHCSEEYSLGEEEKRFFKYFIGKEPPLKLKRGRKCKYCNHTGYRGRTSIQEVLLLNRSLKELILNKATAETLHKKAVEQGMLPLIQDGLRCVENGLTTVNEIIRAAFNSVMEERANIPGEAAILDRLHRDNY